MSTSNLPKIAKDFAIEAHTLTNHHYDSDNALPYSFHLRMVVNVFKEFKWLAESMCAALYSKNQIDLWPEEIEAACWLHDTIEDARINYNDLVKLFNQGLTLGSRPDSELALNIPEMVRAVTNVTRGRTRAERFSKEVANDIVNTSGATFVKLCDRIANVKYSKMMGSSMFDKYRKENDKFLKMLEGPELKFCQEMVNKLQKIFETDD